MGGRDYQVSQFDRVTLARRQPGSAFKPFVYLAAISPAGGLPFTAATMVEDAPITLNVNGKPWSPRNYEDRYEGRVSVRRALEQSLNGATVRMAQVVGAPAIAETAKAFGLVQKAAPIPSLALGALEVTPIDLATAYIPFAGGGLRPGAILLGARGLSGRRQPLGGCGRRRAVRRHHPRRGLFDDLDAPGRDPFRHGPRRPVARRQRRHRGQDGHDQ